MDVAIEYVEREASRKGGYSRPPNFGNSKIIAFPSDERSSRRRYNVLRNTVVQILRINPELYFKLADYAEGIYQFFTDEELKILQNARIFDERNKIDKLTIAAILDASDPNRR